MEKLIELLNEYEYSMFEDKKFATERGDVQDGIIFEKDFPSKEGTMNDTHLISKKYGFIKWLVKNNKIDEENEELISLMSELGERENVEKCLLMLLAIQDEPIDFLCEILK